MGHWQAEQRLPLHAAGSKPQVASPLKRLMTVGSAVAASLVELGTLSNLITAIPGRQPYLLAVLPS